MDMAKLGRMVEQTHSRLTDEDIARNADTCEAWRNGEERDGSADVPYFCTRVALDEHLRPVATSV